MQMSTCLATPRALSIPAVRERVHEAFRYSLGEVNRYAWDFIPEGDILGYGEEGEKLIADRDYVNIAAFRE